MKTSVKSEAKHRHTKYFKCAANIKALREQMGLNKSQFAEQIGISRIMITEYENGRKRPTIENAYQMLDLAADYGISRALGYIFPREEKLT